MNSILKDKKVLFLSWPFYQYPDRIIEAIKREGAQVTYYCSAPTNNFIKVKLLEKFPILKKRYYQKILNEIHQEEFDYLFVINAAIFPQNFLKSIVSNNRFKKKILYSWDSLDVYPNAEQSYPLFDVVYTFDSKDAERCSQVRFLPLFYVDDLYDYENHAIRYNFSFIGFGHSERYNFITSVKKFADQHGYNYFFRLYLPSKFHFYRGKYITKIFKNANKRDFYYKTTSQEKIKEITEASAIVIDLELSNQTGLTMRTIETLGMRKKLITTNKNIVNYDFYNKNNILVVDRFSPQIDENFIKSPYIQLDEEIYQKYTLSNWIKAIFEDEK